jgi:hypothetical protein
MEAMSSSIPLVISKSPPLTPKVVPAVEAAILISPPSNFSERLEFSPTAVVSTPVFVALAGLEAVPSPFVMEVRESFLLMLEMLARTVQGVRL